MLAFNVRGGKQSVRYIANEAHENPRQQNLRYILRGPWHTRRHAFTVENQELADDEKRSCFGIARVVPRAYTAPP